MGGSDSWAHMCRIHDRQVTDRTMAQVGWPALLVSQRLRDFPRHGIFSANTKKVPSNQYGLDTWGQGHLIFSYTGYWGLAVLELLQGTTKIFFQCHNTLVAYGHSINDWLGPIPLLVKFSVRSCPWVHLHVFELSSLNMNIDFTSETPSKQSCGGMGLCVYSELVAACLRGTKGLSHTSRLQPS